MEYYSVIKRKKLLIDTTTWMDLKSIMLSKRSQSQKTTFGMISFISHSGKRRTRGTENISVVA